MKGEIQVTLDPKDIEAIARQVLKALEPLLDEKIKKMKKMTVFGEQAVERRERGGSTRILTVKALCELLGRSRNTVKAYILSDPTFPKKRVFGRGLEGYLEEDIDQWLRSRPAKKEEGE